MKSLLLLLLVSGSALADDGAILRCRELSDPARRLACYDAMVLNGAAGKDALSADPAVAKTALEQSFGMEYNKKTVLDAIESHIPGSFDGWEPNQRIKLANGQLWLVNDDSTGVVYGNNLKVVIRRGAMGAIYMEIDGTNKSPRVRRLQ